MNLWVQSSRHEHFFCAIDHVHFRYFLQSRRRNHPIPLGHLLCVAKNEILFHGPLFYYGYLCKKTIEVGKKSFKIGKISTLPNLFYFLLQFFW